MVSLLLSQDKGKSAYDKGDFNEAREYYEHILKNRKIDDAAQFGLGATAYQQQDMETAARSLNAAMNSKDKSIAAKAMYNLGNMFKDQEKMEESLALYRKAIEIDPTDEDAKINYELMKQVIQQKKQEQEQKSNEDPDKDKEKEKQDSDQDSKGDQEQKQDKNSDPNQDQEKPDQKESESDKEKEKQEQQQSQEKQDDSTEKSDKQMQAEAILNALKDQEKINQKRQISKAKFRKLEKDW